MKKKTVYYAHFMGIYNTKQEERDMELLKTLFPDADIINPNCAEIQEKCNQIKETGGNVMDMFEGIVKGCSVVAFRGCVNGKIGAGVWKEIMAAKECGIPVVELPSYLDREMSVEDTRLMLTELGCR